MDLPLLIGPRLVLRALDDLHAIAEAARRLPGIEQRLTDRMASAEERLGEVIEVAGGLQALDDRAAQVSSGIDRVLAAVDRVDNVEAQVRELVRLAEDLRTGLPTLDEALGSVRELNAAASTLAAAAQPLQGTAERLGRIADRLPGAQRRPR